MEAVNEGAKNADGNALTIGILPGKDKKELSDCVDVGIVSGMDNARNNINILSSDVVIACGYGGSGTASEIALALKSGEARHSAERKTRVYRLFSSDRRKAGAREQQRR